MTFGGSDGFEPPPRSKKVWLLASTLALLVHVAFAAVAITHHTEEPDASETGAPGIVIGLDLSSPQTPPSALPPGPDSDAAASSQASTEQKTEVKPEDLPQDKPTTTEEADRQVTTEKTETPAEKPPEKPTPPSQLSEASVAQESTAAPSIQNAAPAEKSVTREQGTGENRQRARQTWAKELIGHLNKFKRYPNDRSRKSVEIILNIQLDRMGKVVAASIAKSSGDSAFDEAALSMVQRASPVPPPPPLIADDGLVYSLPVIFRKSERS